LEPHPNDYMAACIQRDGLGLIFLTLVSFT